MSEIPLNKFEKHDLVLRLLKEGKTYREICHIAHVSPNDIKPISKKYEQQKRLENKKGEESDQSTQPKKPPLSTQAFQLFHDGLSLIEVGIKLEIPAKNAVRFWSQFLRLERMYECYEFYKDYRHDIPTFLSIKNFMDRNNVYGKDIVTVLRRASDFNTLNQTYYKLKTEIRSLEHQRMYYSHSSYGLQPLPLNKPDYNYYHY